VWTSTRAQRVEIFGNASGDLQKTLKDQAAAVDRWLPTKSAANPAPNCLFFSDLAMSRFWRVSIWMCS
jgi:hypothetical protein